MKIKLKQDKPIKIKLKGEAPRKKGSSRRYV